MKKIITLLALVLPLSTATVMAQGLFSKKEYDGGRQDRSVYMQGAVPEFNGKVVFNKHIEAAGKSKGALYKKMLQWASFRFNPETEYGKWPNADYFKNTEYARVLKAEEENGLLKIQGNEDMIFTNKALAKDMAIASYILTLNCTDGGIDVEMSNISYTYSLSDTPERIEAEDWITDKEAFNKKGQLSKGSGKFRVKTIDLKDSLFEEIEAAAKQNSYQLNQ